MFKAKKGIVQKRRPKRFFDARLLSKISMISKLSEGIMCVLYKNSPLHDYYTKIPTWFWHANS